MLVREGRFERVGDVGVVVVAWIWAIDGAAMDVLVFAWVRIDDFELNTEPIRLPMTGSKLKWVLLKSPRNTYACLVLNT